MREHQSTVPTDPRIAEGYSSANALRFVLRGVLIALMTLAIAGTTLALRAQANGSDSPTPYTLDRTGITLPAGHTFPDNGHVNIRWTGGAAGLHFESKCVTRTDAECAGARHAAAQYIGTGFIPWTAFGVPTDACVTWVQISTFNEHYGEGGQPPVCLTEEEPCPTETETPSTPDPTVEPSPEPSETSSPSPSPTETSSPGPEPSPSATTGPSPEPSADPTPSIPPVSTDPMPTSGVLSQSDTATGARSAGTTPTTDPTARDVLASSGLNLAPLWVALGLLGAGVTLWMVHMLHPKGGGER